MNGLSVYLVTFDLGWHSEVKSRSFGVHWAVYHTQCIIRQLSCQAETPLVCYFLQLDSNDAQKVSIITAKYGKRSNNIMIVVRQSRIL